MYFDYKAKHKQVLVSATYVQWYSAAHRSYVQHMRTHERPVPSNRKLSFHSLWEQSKHSPKQPFPFPNPLMGQIRTSSRTCTAGIYGPDLALRIDNKQCTLGVLASIDANVTKCFRCWTFDCGATRCRVMMLVYVWGRNKRVIIWEHKRDLYCWYLNR